MNKIYEIIKTLNLSKSKKNELVNVINNQFNKTVDIRVSLVKKEIGIETYEYYYKLYDENFNIIAECNIDTGIFELTDEQVKKVFNISHIKELLNINTINLYNISLSNDVSVLSFNCINSLNTVLDYSLYMYDCVINIQYFNADAMIYKLFVMTNTNLDNGAKLPYHLFKVLL